MLLSCGGFEQSTGGDEGITSVSGTGTSGEASTSTTSTTGISAESTSDDSPGMTTGPVKDVGADDWDLPAYCGALDIVLVVEQSGPTWTEMAYHVAYELPAAIEERLPGWSVHYLHVPGTSPAYEPDCEQGCLEDGFCGAPSPEFPCELLGPCDWVTGAGMMWRSLVEKCIEGPRRWVDAGEEDASAIMHCMWKGGENSGSWGALQPTLASVSPALTGPDGCNAGFLREDAWLLPVMLSHGHPGPGDPAEWAAELAVSKGGDLNAVVPVAILDPQTNPSNPPGCQEGPGDHTNGYHELVEQFPFGVIGDLCQPYTPPMLEAIDHIAEVCKAGEVPD